MNHNRFVELFSFHFEKLLLILFLIFCVCFKIQAQEGEVDSLLKLVSESKEDTNKVNLLCRLSENSHDSVSQIQFAQNAMLLANQLNYKKGIADAENCLTNTLYSNGYFKEALIHAKKNLEIREQIKDTVGLVLAYSDLGSINQIIGNDSVALKYFNLGLTISIKSENHHIKGTLLNTFGSYYLNQGNIVKAVDLFERALSEFRNSDENELIGMVLGNLGALYGNFSDNLKAIDYYEQSLTIQERENNKLGISTTLGNIGSTWHDLNDYSKAIDYYQKALVLERARDDKMAIATSLNNIGGAYGSLGNLEKALEFHQQSLKYCEEMSYPAGIALSLNQIGLIYLEKRSYELALNYLNKSMQLYKQNDIKDRMGIVLKNIGNLFIEQKQYLKAEPYCLRSLEIAQKLGLPDLIIKSSELLCKIYEANGNYKKAYYIHILLKQSSDSLNNSTSEKLTIKGLLQFEYEKKTALMKVEQEKKDAIAKAEISKQKTTKNALVGGGVGLLAISVLGFSLYRSRNMLEKIKLQQEIKQQETDLRNEFKDNLHDDLNSEIMAIKGNTEFIAMRGSELDKEVIINITKKIKESCEKILLSNEILIRENTDNADAADELFEDMLNHIEFSLPGIDIEQRNIPHQKTNRLIPLPIRKNYFFIFKECINNIKKHSACSKVVVSWGLEENKLFLEIEDNGKGFDATNNFDGNGLNSFKKRAEKINGKIQILSSNGEGTKIIFEAPVS